MKGVYLVFIKVDEDTEIEVGALGTIEFKQGVYVYCGSARNSVEKRLQRHYSSDKNIHWHIDYLTSNFQAVDHFILPEKSDYECILSEIMEDLSSPIDSFGSSDCNCNSHLYHLG